jgi:ABC-2 type transport system permease protein
MTAAAALTAERIKLSVSRATLGCTLTVAVFSLGFAALTQRNAARVTPDQVVLGLTGFGVLVLMILSAKTVTDEYRTGAIRSAFLATPNRTLVLGAKAAVAATFASVLTAVMVIGSVAVARWVGGPPAAARLPLSSMATWRPLWVLPVYIALLAVLAVAVAALLRRTGFVVGALLLWPAVVEGLLGHVVPQTRAWMPFENASLFIKGYAGGGMLWGPAGGLAYFAGFVALIFGAAALVINRRDA